MGRRGQGRVWGSVRHRRSALGSGITPAPVKLKSEFGVDGFAGANQRRLGSWWPCQLRAKAGRAPALAGLRPTPLQAIPPGLLLWLWMDSIRWLVAGLAARRPGRWEKCGQAVGGPRAVCPRAVHTMRGGASSAGWAGPGSFKIGATLALAWILKVRTSAHFCTLLLTAISGSAHFYSLVFWGVRTSAHSIFKHYLNGGYK